MSPVIQMRILRKMFIPQVIAMQFQISVTSRLWSYSNQLICTYSNQLVLKGVKFTFSVQEAFMTGTSLHSLMMNRM